MNKSLIPTQIKQSSFQLRDFLGIDITTQDSEVSSKRSPDSKNMISGLKGSVDKRYGTKIVNSEFQGENEVYSIQRYKFNLKYVNVGTYWIEKEFYFVHIGNKILYGETLDNLSYIQYRSGDVSTDDFIVSDARINCFALDTPTGYGYIFVGSNAQDANPSIIFIKAIDEDTISVEAWSHFEDLETNLFSVESTAMKKNEGFLYYPITLINRKVGVKNYLSSTGAGTEFEQSNILTKYRFNQFYGDGSGKTFYFDRKMLSGSTVYAWLLDSNGEWQTTTAFTVASDSITFTTAPSAPLVTGTDNVKVLFKIDPYDASQNLEVPYLPKTFATMEVYNRFGLNGLSDYLFLGKKKAPKTYENKFDYVEWYGKFYKQAYFGQYQYTDFPSGIAGYSDYGDLQIVHMEKANIEPSINIRSASTDSSGEIVFPVKTGVSGIWIKSPRSITNFYDEPVWIGESGINAMVTNDVSGENFAQDRGFYINEQILIENGIEDAIGFVYDNKFHIAVNGHVYIADNRYRYAEQKSYSKTYQYEWYYWEDVNINCIFIENDILYYGTKDGLINRFKNLDDEQFVFSDEVKKDAYDWESGILITKGDIVLRNDVYYVCLRTHGTGSQFVEKNFNEVIQNGDYFEVPVISYWTTPILNMGNITALKTLKNLWVRIARYQKSGVEIYYKVRGEISMVKQKNADIFSFNDIDFERFTFNTDSDPEVAVTNRMIRKFMSVQFKFQNSRNEEFSLLEVVGNYTTNSQYKG